jgi:hypothetical protein
VSAPVRVQLRRARGWRLPPETVKVDRSTPWGNPFVVGRDGTRERCVALYRVMLAGHLCLGATPGVEAQRAALAYAMRNLHRLRGKNLACWCRLDGQPCHADVLLELANR